jgi:hypothetical protein
MEEIEYQWLHDFIGEKWVAFVFFLRERGESEATAEAIEQKLKQLADLQTGVQKECPKSP